MPETLAALQGEEAGSVLLEEGEYIGSARIILRDCIQNLAHSEDGPAVGPAPVEGRMLVHSLYPAVAEELLLRNPHLLLEEHNLAYGLIEILGLAG